MPGTLSNVYLLECNGQFKIGHAKNVQQRQNDLSTGNPFEINLVYTIPTETPHALERKLHQQFKAKRVRGEWFALSGEDVCTFLRIGTQHLREEIERAREERDQWREEARRLRYEAVLLQNQMSERIKSIGSKMVISFDTVN